MSEKEYQVKKFVRLLKKYKTYVRDGNLCIFGDRKRAVYMDDECMDYYQNFF